MDLEVIWPVEFKFRMLHRVSPPVDCENTTHPKWSKWKKLNYGGANLDIGELVMRNFNFAPSTWSDHLLTVNSTATRRTQSEYRGVSGSFKLQSWLTAQMTAFFKEIEFHGRKISKLGCALRLPKTKFWEIKISILNFLLDLIICRSSSWVVCALNQRKWMSVANFRTILNFLKF